MLQSILDTEKFAAELIAQAELQAADLIKTAETAAREREREAAVESRNLQKELLEQAQQRIEQDLVVQSNSQRQVIDKQMEQAARRLPLAVEAIVGEVINGHN